MRTALLWCYDYGVDRTGSSSKSLRVVVLAAVSGFMAPLVFVSIILGRKAERRVHSQYRHWNRRLQHEKARWRDLN